LRARMALRESEERLRSIYDAANDAIVVLDPVQDRIIETNAKACALWGYSHAEFIDMPVSKIHPGELDLLVRLWEEVRSNGAARNDRLTCATKAGKRIPAEISASGVWISGCQYMLAMVTDITQREQVLSERARLAAVVEQAAEGIMITDVEGTIEYVNAAFERETGYTRHEAIGKTPRILKSGKHSLTFYKELWATITAGEVWNGCVCYKKKDGTFLEVRQTIFPIRDGSGTVTNFVSVGPNITHEIALENQLRHAQKMEAVGVLSAGIAHDFNNLLTVIFGCVNLAKNALPTDHAAALPLAGIYEAAEQAAGVTRSLLTFTHRMEGRKEPVDLRACVDASLRLLRRVLPTDIEVLSNDADKPAWVNADGTQLQQIIMNLALNARDAMPKGGALTVLVSQSAPRGRRDASDEEMRSEPGGKERRVGRIIITDTGAGMDAEVRERIFEPFFTTKPRGQGTGLGLAIIHSIVEDHNGTIQVESEPEHGTTFTLEFPLLEHGASTAAAERTEPPQQGRGELILVAEDSRHVREILSSALGTLDYEVIQASDGAALMDCVERHRDRIELLVIDVDLPKPDGLECLRDIRSSGSLAPAIIITGRAVSDLEEQLDENTALLRKPFKIADFTALAGRFINSPSDT